MAFRLLDLQRSSQAVALLVAVLLGGLQTVVSIALCTVKLQGGFQTVGSVALHADEPLRGLQTIESVAQLPCVQRNWEVFRLWYLQESRQVVICPGTKHQQEGE